MNEIVDLLQKAQSNDTAAMTKLVEKFAPLVKKNSIYNGKYNEDIAQELYIKLVLCIRNFEFN